MRLPHEQYIRFLITSGLDIDDVNDYLADIHVQKITDEYYQEQHDILHSQKLPHSVKKFWKDKNKKNVPPNFFTYMASIGLKDAWVYNSGKANDFSIALDVAKDIDVSTVVRSLLALRTSHEEISALVNGKFIMSLPKGGIEAYKSYFFNLNIMNRASWKGYLDGLEGTERKILYLSITGQEVEARAELGLPTKISVSQHYQKLHIFAMSKFELYRNSSSPDSDQNALKWAQLAMSAGDKYEKLKLGDATDFTRDVQLEFDYIDADFPMIGEDHLEEISAQKNVEKNDQDSLFD